VRKGRRSFCKVAVGALLIPSMSFAARNGAVSPAIRQDAHIDAGIYAHQVRVAPDNRTVILPTRGNDATSTRPEDPGAIKAFLLRDGQLSDEQSVSPNGGFGFGPRHVDFHPSKPWMFASMERENQLQVFGFKDGRISTQPRFVAAGMNLSGSRLCE
jgi:6-phosphogluconolactonase